MRCMLHLAVAALAAVTPPAVSAISLHRTPEYRLPADERVEEETWVLSGDVHLEGSASRDLFLKGTNAVLNGTFDQAVWCWAHTLSMSGHVAGVTRIAGVKSIVFSGRAEQGLVALGGSIVLEAGADIGEYGILAAETVITEADIRGDVLIIASTVHLGGSITGKARIVAEEISVRPDTVIGGALEYTRSKELIVSDDIAIGGGLVQRGLEDLLPAAGTPKPAFNILGLQLLFLFNAVLCSFLFLLLLPRLAGQAAHNLRAAPGRCLLIGSGVLLLTPLVLQGLFFSRLAILAALVCAGFLLLLLYFSKTVWAVLLGSQLLRKTGAQKLHTIMLSTFVGLLLLYAINMIPFIGPVLWLIVIGTGIGALVMAIVQSQLLPAFNQSQAGPPPLSKPNQPETGNSEA